MGRSGASIDPGVLSEVPSVNRWWFLRAECRDGNLTHRPNRDITGYGDDARLLATIVTAFVLTLPDSQLAVTGRAGR